ncbi:hypothetical protein [Spiroplasma platyhelix]|uniref:Transmembrane protein n=1 Tax=Spiroplasma platyhelix PALS-1 TaxID=1276218 RepID=A0A846TWV0_9MOLU|nr:hypothetical protein [Spiroplasma platyhelix]MBE4704150.1 hypothetical protein [Spiroplasma platyhelix PALS-1]NKE38521.1 hypothetical protein [Spiroplasma platyhelix PALS-1]UJB29408.1 hypothetical protein SPLAT_v1c06440 [Spiroplasma platyhelix PALS-1]
MKKGLSIFSALILTGTATTLLTTNVQTHQNKINQSNSESDIDWSLLKNINNDYFKNFKETHKAEVTNFSARNIDEIIAYAQKKANEYIQLFQNQNFDLNQIIEYLSTENSNFKENYHKSLQNQSNIINNQISSTTNVTTFSDAQDFAKLETFVKNLRIEKAIFTTITATSAIAAAGFWAAAWWFGISIPWAIACTTISTVSGGITTALNGALVEYDKELSKIDKAIIWGSMIYYLGHIFYKFAYITLIAGATTVTATSWAFPAVLALVPVISTISTWISVYK